MSDFETMPVGTRAAMREAAAVMRESVECGWWRGVAAAAAKLEALLVQPGVQMEHGPQRIPDEIKPLLQGRHVPLHNGSGVPGDDLPLDGV